MSRNIEGGNAWTGGDDHAAEDEAAGGAAVGGGDGASPAEAEEEEAAAAGGGWFARLNVVSKGIRRVQRGFSQQPAGAGGKKPGHSQHLRPLTWQQKMRWGFVALLVILGVRTTVTDRYRYRWLCGGRMSSACDFL